MDLNLQTPNAILTRFTMTEIKRFRSLNKEFTIICILLFNFQRLRACASAMLFLDSFLDRGNNIAR
jgi:hypothetical protein